MKKYGLIIGFITAGILISWILASTIGMFEIPDAYFYVTLGTYLFTGRIALIAPFNLELPQTLFGPVYSILSYIFFNYVPITPLFSIPFFQLLLVVASAILLSLVLKKLIPKVWVPLGVMIFLILPFQIVYAFFMMSETVTTFLFMLYVAVVVLFPKKSWQGGMLVLVASIMVLTRYAFLPIAGISLLFWLIRRPKTVRAIVPAVVGIVCISLWVGLHIRLYHTPLVSTFTGRHLYNNVVTQGKFIPKDHSNPEVAKFFAPFPSPQVALSPWWEIQGYFAPAFKNKVYNEIEIDRLFLWASLEGIKEHPIGYIIHLLKIILITPNTPPFHENVLSQLGFVEKKCVLACAPRDCRFTWLPSSCKPLNENQTVNTLFGYWIIANQTMYPVLSFILEILAIIGIIAMVLTKKPVLLSLVGLFVLQHTFQSATEWVEGRFLLPLYPLYTILIMHGIIAISRLPRYIPRRLSPESLQ